MRIEVLSAAQARTYEPQEKHIAISIGTEDNISLPRNDNRIAELYLLFDDLDTNLYFNAELLELYKKQKVHLFTDEMAQEILEFIFCNPCDLLVVNCEAGVSRSAGVAAAIGKIFNGDDKFIFDNPKYYPNMYAYHKIITLASSWGLL